MVLRVEALLELVMNVGSFDDVVKKCFIHPTRGFMCVSWLCPKMR